MLRTFVALSTTLAHTANAVCVGSEGIEINISGCGDDGQNNSAADMSQDYNYVLESGNLPQDMALRVPKAFCEEFEEEDKCEVAGRHGNMLRPAFLAPSAISVDYHWNDDDDFAMIDQVKVFQEIPVQNYEDDGDDDDLNEDNEENVI